MFSNKKVDILDECTADTQNSIIRDLGQLSETEAPSWGPDNQIDLVGVFSFIITMSDNEKVGPPYRRLCYKKLASMFDRKKDDIAKQITTIHKRMDDIAYEKLTAANITDPVEWSKLLVDTLTHAFINECTDWQDNDNTFEFMKIRVSYFWATCITQI